MPNPVTMSIAMLVSFMIVILGTVLIRVVLKTPAGNWLAMIATVCTAIAFVVGSLVVGLKLKWPAVEDQHRLFLWLLPALLVAQPLMNRSLWERYIAIVLWSVFVPLSVLWGSSYLDNFNGPGSRLWSFSEILTTISVVAILNIMLYLNQFYLAKNGQQNWAMLHLAMLSLATGLLVMLSGYLTAGQYGLPLAGATMGLFLLGGSKRVKLDVSFNLFMPVSLLLALLAMGRFFGEVKIEHAFILVLSPLLVWLVYAPFLPAFVKRHQHFLGVLILSVPLILVVGQAGLKFQNDSKIIRPGSPDGEIDYSSAYGL